MNLFATVLTYPAPSANYRGESEENRSVIQKITRGRHEYAIISPEAIRNALREILRGYGLPSNRERLDNEDQLAVKFADYPFPEKYVDDFIFGYMVADRKQVPEKIVKERGLKLKRDSVLRMNMAVALEPYRHDAVFTQSPLTSDSPWQNAKTSALLHRETTVTAFQFPFALNLGEFEMKGTDSAVRRNWFTHLLKAVSELNGVAGNHARSYFEMAPASIVIRLSSSLVGGYDSYGFRQDGTLPEVVQGILKDDFPGSEFILGGQLVRDLLPSNVQVELAAKGASLHRTSREALEQAAQRASGLGLPA